MRAFAAIPIAVVVCAAAPAFADASHVNAAHKAERRGDWRKALQEWKAAYAAEPNAEYLIGIGDAQAQLGNRAEAKESYEAYVSDPLAVPATVRRVQAKLAQLDSAPSGALALPGPGLTLPGAQPSSPPPLPAPSSTASSKTAKADTMLPLPGLGSPAGLAQSADKSPPPLPLPGVAPAKKEAEKVASGTPIPPLPLPAKPEAGKKEAAPAVATKEPAKPAKPIAMAMPTEKTPAPAAAIATPAPLPREGQAASSSGIQRTVRRGDRDTSATR